MEYQVELTNTTVPATPVTTTTAWLPAATVVTGGIGTILQSPALTVGTYAFRIQVRNALGATWSLPVAFTVGTVPVAPVGTAPVGVINTATPSYTFNPVPWAAEYSVQVTNTLTSAVTTGPWVTAASVGAGAILQAPALDPGTYSWTIQARNVLGVGPLSAPVAFTVGAIPVAPAPTAPINGSIGNSTTPAYVFPAVTWGMDYSIELTNTTTASAPVVSPGYPASAIVAGGVGTILQSPALAVGVYSFRVNASNALGIGPWSLPVTFTVGTVPVAPVGSAPSGAVASANPTYTFNTVAWAAEYQVVLTNTNTGATSNSGWLTAASVGAGATGSIPQTAALVAGNYTWTVQARNVLGSSPLSAPVAFTVGTVPAAPVGTTPTGNITTTTPTYTFNTVAWAVDYSVQVTDTATNITTTGAWIPASTVGTGATGTLAQASALPAGNYSWVVQARNALGTGPLSLAVTFSVGSIPVAPVGTTPLGNIASTTPIYTFNTVAWAADYSVELTSLASGAVTTMPWIGAASVGTGAVGTIAQAPALAMDNYSWRVAARNALGTGPWSSPTAFTVGTIPAAPVPVSPAGLGVGVTPTYTFNTVPGATGYSIYLWNGTTSSGTLTRVYTTLEVDPLGTGTGRITDPVVLAFGSYVWNIQAKNALGSGLWSPGTTFTVGAAPSTPTPISPAGTGVSATPTYTFNTSPGATGYTIFLWNGTTNTGTQTRWYTALEVDPLGTGTGTITDPVVLAFGNYVWNIQAQNAIGTSAWSAGTTFTVGGVPVAPVPISPASSGVSSTPTYTFKTVPGATAYNIFLWNGTANTGTQTRWYTSLEVDPLGTGTGTITDPVVLAPGNYVWNIQAQNAMGMGAWSVGTTFTVGGVPSAPIPIAPASPGTSPTPAYTFQTVPGATGYSIFLWNGTTNTGSITRWYTALEVDPLGTGTGTIVDPAVLTPGYYSWFIQAQNSAGAGPYSVNTTFSVP